MKSKSWEQDKFFYPNRARQEKVLDAEIRKIVKRASTIAIYESFVSKEAADKIRLQYELEDGLVINMKKEKRIKL
jgi:hypothetical protein